MRIKDELIAVLFNLQENCIGIAKIDGNVEMVMSETQHTFKTLSISNLCGLKETFYPKSEFQFENFPVKYNSLYEFLKEPNVFHNWYNEYLK